MTATWLRRDTLAAKNTPDRSTPTRMPLERSAVATTTRTVSSITTDDGHGFVRNFAKDRYNKVLIDTMIMTAMSAATRTTASSL